jgi:dTDP-4-amino-4,6-dideoxy-D-galactose acyltransferase
VTPDPPAELLSWDSEFFGHRIARVNASPLDSKSLDSLVAWASREAVECIYYLVEPCDFEPVRRAIEAGFRPTGVRMTLRADPAGVDRAGKSAAERSAIRPATSDDLPVLRRIAGRVHRGTRFYNDPGFPDDACSELYARWISRDVEGGAAAVLVSDDGAGPLGYVSCLLRGESEGSVGLLGVSEDHRGRGLGGALLDASLEWFVRKGVRTVSVVTQGCRPEAQRLYQSRGFRTLSVGLWLHWWSG